MKPEELKIDWPENIRPEDYIVHAYNKLFIPAPPNKIWDVLIQASEWPQWYANCAYLRIINSTDGSGKLQNGTEFVWRTFHTRIISKVIEYKENESIGWTAKGFGTVGYHGWKLFPQTDGTWVVTEEVQKSWGVWLLKFWVNRGLLYWHQKWLEGIKECVALVLLRLNQR